MQFEYVSVWRKAIQTVILGSLVLAAATGCHTNEQGEPGLALPADIENILSKTHSDPAGDQVIAPADGPPEVVHYPPSDLIGVRLGVRESVLYMRVTFAGLIPKTPFTVPARGVMPAQVVKDQAMSLNMDIDNDVKTGAAGSPVMNGIDIFYAVQFIYGVRSGAYVNYDFPAYDIHANRGHLEGTILEGGPGSDHVTFAFDVSSLGSFFPRGRSVVIGAWYESQSFRVEGNLLYHHFAYDPTTAESWTIPL